MIIYHAHLHTGHFDFDAYGRTRQEMQQTLLDGYLKHMDGHTPRTVWTAEQELDFGRALTTYERLNDYFGVNVIKAEFGHCYRDWSWDITDNVSA